MRIEEERFYPDGFMPPWVRYQHLERYRWAAKFVAGKRVLDVACGTGYGTALLAKAGAAQVDGFDCSPEAVAFAKKTWALPNISFGVAITDRLPVPDGSYDCYVSFETIEHVEDDDALLTEATRVLRPGGSLLVSTPNRELLDPGISIDDRPFNRFHIREYCRDEFEREVAAAFRLHHLVRSATVLSALHFLARARGPALAGTGGQVSPGSKMPWLAVGISPAAPSNSLLRGTRGHRGADRRLPCPRRLPGTPPLEVDELERERSHRHQTESRDIDRFIEDAGQRTVEEAQQATRSVVLGARLVHPQ